VAVTAPCLEACPAKARHPRYIELIRNNKFGESLNLIRKRCICPVSSGALQHPLREACVRNGIDNTWPSASQAGRGGDNDLAAAAAP